MKLIIKIIALLSFITLIGIVIAYGRGYRWSLEEKSFTSTGILAVSSYPKAAKIYINEKLRGVTDTNLVLPPGNYHIEIKKDGYTSWTKTIKLQGELVYSADALLFPLNPSLSPLTNLGIVKTYPVDQTEKVIIFSDNNDPLKDGIYLFETTKKPLSLLPPLKLISLKKDLPISTVNFEKTKIYLSPDYKEAIFEFNNEITENRAYLFSLDGENKDPFEVTESKDTLLTAWEEERNNEVLKILETFPKELVKVASNSFNIISFSPDKTKMLYQPKKNLQLPEKIKPPMIAINQTPEERKLSKNNFYVYDKKENQNYRVSDIEFLISNKIANYKSLLNESSQLEINNLITWFPDSKHLVFAENNKISVIDYDNQNKQTLYSGPFEKPFFIVTTDGNIAVSANLNPEMNQFPDLYLVGIK